MTWAHEGTYRASDVVAPALGGQRYNRSSEAQFLQGGKVGSNHQYPLLDIERDRPGERPRAGAVAPMHRSGWLCSSISDWMASHIRRPRGSMYRSGWRIIVASDRSSSPPNTMRLASAMALRVLLTMWSISSTGASISIASCTGAQTEMPSSVARQQARRSISAPLACIGKFRIDLGLAEAPR